MKNLILFFALVYCCSCNENDTDSEPTTAKNDTSHRRDNQKSISVDTSIYRIRLSDTVILSLQQWDTTLDLERHLGRKLKQNSRKLDNNSDTFSGSLIKELEYDGLKLLLFSPAQNGKTFWIQEITLTSEKYKTTSGIGIGDEWEQVKQIYPSIKQIPGGNKGIYQVADERYEKTIEFRLENNKVKNLRMTYLIN